MKIKFHEGSLMLEGTAVSVAGMVMPLVKSFRADSQGTYVVVDGTPIAGLPDGQIRVKVSARDSYEAMPDDTPVQGNDALATLNETDNDIKNRLRRRFELLSEMTKAVKKGDEVKLVGFGTFTKAKRKARTGRNPQTGKEIKIPASWAPKFRPGSEFKSMLN